MPLVRIDRVDWLLVASDLRRRRDEPDFVVGPGPASFLLARYVRRTAPGRALDLGCGSGIQSLVLAASGADVLALDINPRALGFTRFNAALNGIQGITTQLGDFLIAPPDPTFDGRFDTVVANPPFVLAPAPRLLYRDRPLPGHEVGERTVRQVGRSLAPGGRGYVLCVWIDRDAGPWQRSVEGWVEHSETDTLVILVASETPAQDAAAWNRALPDDRRAEAILEWTAALEAEGVRTIHLGVVALGRPGAADHGPPRFAAVVREDLAVTERTVESFLADRRGLSPLGRVGLVGAGATSGAS